MKNYFSFTRSQQIGVVVWTVVIVGAILVLNLSFESRMTDPFRVPAEDLEYVQLNVLESHEKFQVSYSENAPEISYSLFEFDPNKIEVSDWEKLGFSKKQAQAIVNYRTKFGPFKVKTDLKKVFVISEEKYAELEPYILLESTPDKERNAERIQINAATVEQLESLPGIGSWTAENIIRKRNALGGFSNMTQLHEVYKMSEEIYQILLDNCDLDPAEIKTININTASRDEIDRHPYIDFDATAVILKERETKIITSLDFLISKNVMTKEELEKLKPYIRFE